MDPVVANQSFFSKYKFTIVALFVILLAAVPLLLLSNTAKKTTQQPTTTMISPTPQVTLTPQNADAVLGQTDTDMQTALSQLDTDLQASQVDASQDSTTGL